MSLYQSYRPKNFSDVVGQDFVKKVLMNSCKTRTFHHGYIFFGFHGIGKTTLARIFAEGINCTNITADGNPCHTCENCLSYDNGKMIDVIEIDAASYTGVDNIREVIDHAKFTPTQGKYKVYIIDEVHMLSKGAFNALLKTLEEPPAHAIFLLATTEINKIPDTILSRVIRFDLTKIGEADMRWLLQTICTQESIKYQEEALNMIIHRSRGSLRDSLTMLEKCIIDATLTIDNVEHALHLVNTTFLKKTFDAVRSGKSESIQDVLSTLETESTDIRQFSAQMTEWIVDHIGEAFEQKAFQSYREIFDLFTQIFIQSKQVAVPMDILRMALYERIQDTVNPPIKKQEKIPAPEKNITMSAQEPDIKEGKEITQPIPQPEPELPTPNHTLHEPAHELPSPSHELIAPTHEIMSPENQWSDDDFSGSNFLKKIQEQGIKSTLLPLLRTASFELQNDEIKITTTSFGKTRCEEPATHGILLAAAKDFWAEKISIITLTDTSTEEVQTDSVDMARAIFE